MYWRWLDIRFPHKSGLDTFDFIDVILLISDTLSLYYFLKDFGLDTIDFIDAKQSYDFNTYDTLSNQCFPHKFGLDTIDFIVSHSYNVIQ